jgi:hypothetical protein
MASTVSIGMFGDKVVIGALDTSFLTANARLFPGTLVANGPCYFGMPMSVGVARATVMIGPPIGISVPASLEVTGIANIFGVLNVIAVSNFTGLCTKMGTTIKNALSLKNGVDIKNAVHIGNAIGNQNGNYVVAGTLTVAGVIACAWLEAQLATARALPGKSFDIKHPSKPKHRLRHGCLEGPELGVYIRGSLEGENVIHLPQYWKELVDIQSITVQLTPMYVYQELSWEITDWGTKIKVTNNAGSAIRCSYIVHGTRKDLDPLIVEYEGESPKDYPGQDFLGMKEIYGGES